MNASEIAETLLNGNIALARQEILWAGVEGSDFHETDPYAAAAMALDVVAELSESAPPGCAARNRTDWALAKVRRCLEGAP